jgi:protein-S-isoprenylcysteine O-methyltransferase Ste14
MSNGKWVGFLGVPMAAGRMLSCFAVLWPGPWNAARYIGVVLAITGIVLLFVARFQLGRSFSVTAQSHKLVTHGLYSRIRNPIYVFSSTMVVGILLVLQRPFLFVLFAVLMVVQTWRARNEASVLEAKFGAEYREYRSKTWF